MANERHHVVSTKRPRTSKDWTQFGQDVFFKLVLMFLKNDSFILKLAYCSPRDFTNLQFRIFMFVQSDCFDVNNANIKKACSYCCENWRKFKIMNS